MGTASITLVGTLIADPETRKTGKGTTICTFKLPTHEGWGENQVTTWWRCIERDLLLRADPKFDQRPFFSLL